MHRDTRHEVRSQLVRYELTGTWYELTGVRVAGSLSGLLRRQLRELLCDQVVVLRESLQQLMLRLLKLMLRLLKQRRIDLLRTSLWLLPYSTGLAGTIRYTAESADP